MGLLSGMTRTGLAHDRASTDHDARGALAQARFRPPLGLRNGHIQSILAATELRQRRAESAARGLLDTATEVILDCGEGVRLQAFHSPAARTHAGGGSRGLVVLLHGWEGTAGSSYLIVTGQHLVDLGFDVVRLHYRDHGNTHRLNEGVFHSCRIREVVGAVGAVGDLYRPRQLLVAGFSLGGNFALRVGLHAPAAGIDLAALVAVNPVIDPAHTMVAMESGWSFYERHFLRKWQRSLRSKQQAFPGIYDFEPCMSMTSLRAITAYVAERYTGFNSLEAYLDGYSLAGDRLAALEVPTTIVTAEDDPLIPIDDFRALRVPGGVALRTLPYGGHCAFLEGYQLDSWLERSVAEHLAEQAGDRAAAPRAPRPAAAPAAS